MKEIIFGKPGTPRYKIIRCVTKEEAESIVGAKDGPAIRVDCPLEEFLSPEADEPVIVQGPE